MADVREVWRRSHGYREDQLHRYAEGLEWLLDDSRFQGPGFTPPEAVSKFFQLAQMMEAEVIRLMSAGPPYEPRADLDGAFGLAHIHAFFPPRWVEFLSRIGMPESAITAEMAKEWEPLLSKGVALRNGNMLSNHAWGVSDPVWSLLFPTYLALLLDPSIKAPWSNNPAWIKVDDADELSFALAGDWSTGVWTDGDSALCPPDAVMREIEKLDVDYTVHLGDVYPVGSPRFYKSFLDGWKPGRRGAFNFNGNHDMYAWAKGYVEACSIRRSRPTREPPTSPWSSGTGSWSGSTPPYRDSSMLVGAGSVRDPDQTAFLQRVRARLTRRARRSSYSPTTSRSTPWNEDHLGVGRRRRGGCPQEAPDVWYFGHYQRDQ